MRRYIFDNVRQWFATTTSTGCGSTPCTRWTTPRAVHLLEELAEVAADLSAHLRRPLTLIAESDLNDPRLVTPREAGGYGLDAQWSDDFHHALHVALTGETQGYYADFAPLSPWPRCASRASSTTAPTRASAASRTARRSTPRTVPTWRLVACSQNHDQIGNRAARRPARPRHSTTTSSPAPRCSLLTAPFTPMLFMGEEWAASTPFQFFTSHPEPELAAAATEGRLAEFARMGWDPDDVPDPQDPETFASAKLDWAELEAGRHPVLLEVYRELITLRRQYAELTNPVLARTSCRVDEEARWFLMRRGGLAVVANFGDAEAAVDLGGRHQLRWATPSGARVAGTTVVLPPHAGAFLLPLKP